MPMPFCLKKPRSHNQLHLSGYARNVKFERLYGNQSDSWTIHLIANF